jgi:hypothetical protein
MAPIGSVQFGMRRRAKWHRNGSVVTSGAAFTTGIDHPNLEFMADCPVAPATQASTGHCRRPRPSRRRRSPALPAPTPEFWDALGRTHRPTADRARDSLSGCTRPVRLLPAGGWTGGLLGQRDRCLLGLSDEMWLDELIDRAERPRT